uniref:Uncharacterized protein n=1 Tax=Rhizophora mucronata TaxID=61149 RepID=A0A2P2P2P4_RHIMU
MEEPSARHSCNKCADSSMKAHGPLSKIMKYNFRALEPSALDCQNCKFF